MTQSTAHLLAEMLVAAGVERIYGVVGDSLNGFTDALRSMNKIKWIHMRNEEAAAFAAGADAHVTGKLAVCAGSCGPGNLHLINGLYDCQRSGVPVLAIAAHIPSTEIGIDYFQATHPEILFKECSHFTELVSNPSQLPTMVRRAIRTAVGRRGVSVVVIPGDVALKPAEGTVPTWVFPEPPLIRPNEKELGRLAKFLNDGNRVTLFCGAGSAGAHAEVVQLAQALQAPIVHTLRGKEHMEYDNPYDVGMTGFAGFASGYNAMKNCDTLLLLGTDFPYRQFYPAEAKVAQVDVRAEALGNRCALDIGVIGDVKTTLQALLPLIKKRNDAAHLEDSLADYKRARANLDSLADVHLKSDHIHPQTVTAIVSELATEDAIFTVDTGTPIIWAARYLKTTGKRRILGSFNHGSMANAMLQAIGAQQAFPKRQVISMSGDGGFAMMMGDFLTLTQMGLPVKIVLLNNGTLGFVQLEQMANGFLDTGTSLKNPNFANMAAALGIKSVRIEKPSELRAKIKDALDHDGPALIDVVTPSSELAMPPVTKLDDAYHFGLFAMKAVLDGRAKELIDLAKTALIR